MCFCIADIENLFNENKGGGSRRDIVSIRVMSGSVSGPAQPKRAWKPQNTSKLIGRDFLLEAREFFQIPGTYRTQLGLGFG